MSDQVERAWLRWFRAAATKQPVMLVLKICTGRMP